MKIIPRYSFKNKIRLQRTLLVVAVCILTSVFSLQSQKRKDGGIITFTERFGIDSDRLYPSTNLKKFSQRLDSLVLTDSLGRIDVIGYASVDGSEDLNETLASGRANVVRDWLLEKLPFYPAANISIFSYGQDWMALRQLVIDDTEVPSRDRAIDIIESDAAADVKVGLLKKLSNGATWQYLVKNILPYMRVAKVNIEYFRKPVAKEITEIHVGETLKSDEAAVMEPAVEEITEVTEVMEETVNYADCGNQPLALKTNLLYDAILMPTLEVEYKFNDRWSVGLEGSIAWWENDLRHRYYRIMTVTPEVRYHFKSDKAWQGHYLGLFAGCGKYDLENGARGYMGNGGYLGISYNYMWNVSKYFSLELGLGVGAMFTRYKEYLPIDGQYIYQRTNDMWYGGPLRAKFALVWRLWDVKCKERKQ